MQRPHNSWSRGRAAVRKALPRRRGRCASVVRSCGRSALVRPACRAAMLTVLTALRGCAEGAQSALLSLTTPGQPALVMSATRTRTPGAHAALRAPYQPENLPPQSLRGRADGAQSKLLNLNAPSRPALLYVSVSCTRAAGRAHAAARPPHQTEHSQPESPPPASPRRRRTARTSKPGAAGHTGRPHPKCAAPPRTHPHLRAPPPNAHSESRAQNGTTVTARPTAVRTCLQRVRQINLSTNQKNA